MVDPGVLGWRTEAYVEVYCKGKVLSSDLRRAFVDIPEVASACTLTGKADALLRVLARDVGHLEQVLEQIRATPSVDATRSEIVLSTLFSRSS